MNYTVRRGDNLWTLAKQHGVPLQDLMRQVPESVRRDPRTLQPGMTLTLPGPDRTAPVTSQTPSQGNPYSGMMVRQPVVPNTQYGPEVPRMSSWNGDPGVSPQAKAQQAMERGLVGGTMAGMEALTGGAELRALGRGAAGLANRVDDAYGSGAVVDGAAGINRGINKLRDLYPSKADELAGQRQARDMFYPNEPQWDQRMKNMEGLMPGQQRVQRLMDQGLGGNIPLQPGVGRMAQSNPNMSLESLHRFMGPGKPMPSAGTTVRTHPDRFGSVIRNNPDREKYAQGLERLPGGSWGKKVYDSKAPLSNEEFDLWAAASRYGDATGRIPSMPSGIDRLTR